MIAAQPPMTRYSTPQWFRCAQSVEKSGWERSGSTIVLQPEAEEFLERVESPHKWARERPMDFVIEAKCRVRLANSVLRAQGRRPAQKLGINGNDAVHGKILPFFLDEATSNSFRY